MADAAPAPTEKPLCFVIGPIGPDGSEIRKHADFMLHGLIKHVLETDEFGYRVKRADEDADPGMINDRMISDILNADLVVADLTGLNPNAFYELGIRHAAEKPVIHVAAAGTKLPFDNVAHRTTFVDVSNWHELEQARKRLADTVRHIRAPGYQVSNPITQANASFKMRASSDPRDKLISELQDRVSTLENRARHGADDTDANIAELFRVQDGITVSQGPVVSARMQDAWRRVMLAPPKVSTSEGDLPKASEKPPQAPKPGEKR